MLEKITEIEEKVEELEVFAEEFTEKLEEYDRDIDHLKDVTEEVLTKILHIEAKIDAVVEILCGNAILAQNEVDTIAQDNLQLLYSDLMKSGSL